MLEIHSKTLVGKKNGDCRKWVSAVVKNGSKPQKERCSEPICCSENGCAQVSFQKRMHAGVFWKWMRATKWAILTDAHDGLLSNGCTQDMGQILDVHNLHLRATPLTKEKNMSKENKKAVSPGFRCTSSPPYVFTCILDFVHCTICIIRKILTRKYVIYKRSSMCLNHSRMDLNPPNK